jgi:hypothetical protein
VPTEHEEDDGLANALALAARRLERADERLAPWGCMGLDV